MLWFWIAVAIGALSLLIGLMEVLRRRHVKQRRRACKRFRQQREHLEADFFRFAATSGKPRGLIWKNCEWGNDIVFARDRVAGLMVALVGVTIEFEAVQGSDMEGLPAVGNLRNASGVFFHERGQWRTTGKVVFNLNPDEAIDHFQQQYERIPCEPTA